MSHSQSLDTCLINEETKPFYLRVARAISSCCMFTMQHNLPWQQQKQYETQPFQSRETGPLFPSLSQVHSSNPLLCVHYFHSNSLKEFMLLLGNSPKHSLLHFEAMGSSHSLVIWLLLTEMRSQEKNLGMLKNSFLFEHNLQWDVKIWSK